MAPIDFRRIDVDQYDEDRLDPSTLYHPDPRSAAQILSDAQQTDKLVRGLVQRGDTAGALQEALKVGGCPYGEDADPQIRQAKATALATVLAILNSTRSTDIPDLVQNLSSDQQLWLMKYLYKAMESLGDTSGNVVLGWHEKLTEVAGIGCIVRVMSDRRRV
ncbi:hypothetical protein JCM10908_000792 [Rhodotorula pacifica]|uniref:Arc15p n=1 Tax=Rhodotorula pacifica TaxID=1495444 RepID=UPI00317F3614